MHPTTMLRVTSNTGDVVEQAAAVVVPGMIEVVRPLVAALVAASDGIPRQRSMLPPLQQYTVQGLALASEAACFRVYASPRAPIPPPRGSNWTHW